MPEIQQLQILFDKYMRKQCSKQELEVLLILLQHTEAEGMLNPAMQAVWDKLKNGNTSYKVDWEKMYTTIINLKQDVNEPESLPRNINKGRLISWTRLKAAAIIFLVIMTGIYFIFFNRISRHVVAVEGGTQKFKNDVKPGTEGAILTLADGSKIILDSANNGILTSQGNTRIIKQNGLVTYSDEGNTGDKVLYNIMATPKGRQFNLVLADGSKVWLNASSSITFPNAFIGTERKVEITGEAYFEVATSSRTSPGGEGVVRRPFIVSVNGMIVQVLGTHFNINAYDDENIIRTTLLEGSVKIIKGSASKIIKPGEQAQIENPVNPSIPQIKVADTDIDEAVAWKNGRFQFESADIKVIMRQLARWYDVDIVYEGDIRPRAFTGKISRNVNASKVLNMLEYANVHFRIEGKTIVIMP